MTRNARSGFEVSVLIERPPSLVFAWLADVQDKEPMPRRAAVRMVKQPAGTTRVGTCWHEQVRMAWGPWLHVESVATSVEPPENLEMDFHSSWFSGHLAYDLEPVPEGTILHQRETLHLRPLLGWVAPVIVHRLRSHVVARLDDIKTALEASP